MHDIKWIRANPDKFDQIMKNRGLDPVSGKIIELDESKRHRIAEIQELQQKRNEVAKSMGSIKDKSGEEFQKTRKEAENIKSQIAELSGDQSLENQLQHILERLPNILDDEVPVGESEADNKLIKTIGEKPKIDDPKEHYILGENLGLMDFEITAKMSGSRFVTLKGDLAKLERALISFMIDIHTSEFGFQEISPPSLVRDGAMYNTGQLPNLAEDSFETTNNYRLIPTGEVPLTNLVADSIQKREDIPLRFTAYTPCYRSEAGSAGRDTHGMLRVHQFGKVELVTISTPDESESEHQHMLKASESILQKLEIPYQVMLLCSGDIGFAAAKTYDIEAWMPGQNKYREISSVSNCWDFQSRRMKARYKELMSKDTTFLHTLNGSGLAVGRTIIAIMENYQNPDGSIRIPKVLQSYMNGQEVIKA